MPIAQVTYVGTEYFAGWGTLMLINAALARCMGRTGLGWFFLSLFLGPLATLLLAVFGPVSGPKR